MTEKILIVSCSFHVLITKCLYLIKKNISIIESFKYALHVVIVLLTKYMYKLLKYNPLIISEYAITS